MLLRNLSLKNVGIIDSADIEFEEGLNVLTGETGAGKSLVINAFNLLLGERVNAESIVRGGEEEATVEAVLDMGSPGRIDAYLKKAGIDTENRDVLLKRTISRSERNKCFINSSLASLSVMKEFGSLVADICGSHSHQELLNSDNHEVLLDRFCGNEGLLGEWNRKRAGYLSLCQAWQSLDEEERVRDEKLAVYRMQREELKFIEGLKESEQELQERHNLMSHAEKITSKIQELQSIISGGENSLISLTKNVVRGVEFLSEFRKELLDFRKEAELSLETFLELQREIDALSEKTDYDPRELEVLEENIFLVRKMKSKHNRGFEELKDLCKELDEKIRKLENMDVARDDLKKRMADSGTALAKTGQTLLEKRKKGAAKLEKLLDAELRELAIRNVRFQVRFAAVDPDPARLENVEFFIQTNAGEEPKPLKDIVSSGEVSRIMLALKIIFSEIDEIPILIFDEIDANIGGETAVIVGKKLKDISRGHQVIVITHMPQIATFARRHLSVSKTERKGRSSVTVSWLDRDERVKEIARMMGGENITSVVTKHAEELIKGGGS
jgi:DNA repair protein RecN (Recombination protein N)